MKPFFYYMGSKYRLSHKKDFYDAPCGDIVCEPFAGSACYSVVNDVELCILIDKNKKIIDLWNFLITADEQQILDIPSRLTDKQFQNLDHNQRFLVGLWVSRGTPTPRNSKLPKQYIEDKRNVCNTWGDKSKQRIVSQLHLIRKWRAVHDDYSHGINVDADLYFIDPPYSCDAAKAYKYHDIDYSQYINFINELKSRNKKIIICENSDHKMSFKKSEFINYDKHKKIEFYNNFSKKIKIEHAFIINRKEKTEHKK